MPLWKVKLQHRPPMRLFAEDAKEAERMVRSFMLDGAKPQGRARVRELPREGRAPAAGG